MVNLIQPVELSDDKLIWDVENDCWNDRGIYERAKANGRTYAEQCEEEYPELYSDFFSYRR